MIQFTGDVKTNGAETIPIRVNLLVRNVLPCDDMLFSSERSLTIEIAFIKATLVGGGCRSSFFSHRCHSITEVQLIW